jgi:hypothetical protein
MNRNYYLAAVLLGILLLVLPVSAVVVNLSQSYECFSVSFVKWENFDSPLDVVADNSVLMWVNFNNLPTNDELTFTLTFNDLSQVEGSIVTRDTSLISGETVLSLGSMSNTTTYSHLPLVGVAPRYNLGYGIDSTGLHYLVLLEESRTGASPKDGRYFLIDTDLDVNVPISPPANNPIIRFEKLSGTANMDGYVLENSVLQNGCPALDKSWLDMLLGAMGAGVGIFLFVGSFLVDNIQYVPLAMILGEGLLLLYCLDKKKDIIEGLGLFLDKNLYIADIVQRILLYSLTAFWTVWDALVKWL